MAIIEYVSVKIGEVKTGKSPDILNATLGSCVGIAFIWKEKGLYGLAHCLLPEAPTAEFKIGAKYVSHAVPSLLKMMNISQEDYSQIEVFVAGGGNMMAVLSQRNSQHIGFLNAEAATKHLNKLGLKIKHSDFGGEEWRKMVVNCATGDVEIVKIPQESFKKAG